MNFKLHGSNSTEQMDINRKVGMLGEKIAKDDYRKNGYHTLDTRPGSFFDFVAMRFLDSWKLDIVFVEVKVGNSQHSRRQTRGCQTPAGILKTSPGQCKSLPLWQRKAP